MYIEYMLLAQDSSVDQEKKVLSVFSILEDINMKSGLTQVNFPLQVIISIRREEEVGQIDSSLKLCIQPPNGQSISLDLPFQMKPVHKRFRLVANTALQISGSGTFKFLASLKNDLLPQREMSLNIGYEKT